MQTFKMSRSIYLWDWERWHCWSIWRIESFQLCLIGVWILPTLDWLYSTCWSLKALSLHKIERTCEFEKDDNIDPFDKSNPFNRFQLVSGYSQPWIGFILKDCPMDNVYSMYMLMVKGEVFIKLNVPVGFDKDDIINPYDKYLSGYHFSDLQRISILMI